ncbi:MAG: NfeD family protein [Clostridia bacterium]|nr:NfeD family protein [Clostridia bacterium]
MEIYYGWLILAGVLIVLEIFTEGFLICWFGIGALIAMITSFFAPENYLLQIIVFTVVSIILVLFTRKFAKKVAPNDVPSNVYTILGKKAIVTTEIDNATGKGQIKVDGDIWSAKSESGEKIPVDSSVEILRIDGVKVVVK